MFLDISEEMALMYPRITDPTGMNTNGTIILISQQVRIRTIGNGKHLGGKLKC